MNSFTQEDLVQYLYKETSPEKSALLKAALINDWMLRENYEVMFAAFKDLEMLTFSPRKIAVDNILNYAERAVKELPTEV